MSFSSFSDNDDDLFDDSSSSNSFFQNKPTLNSSEEIQSLIESIEKKDLENIDSMIFRSRVALTLLDSANSYIFENNSYNRSIFNTLNFLTDNKFQYHLYADVLEESLIRRFVIRDFLVACLDSDDSDLLEKLSKVVNVNIDKRFLLTYFQSTLEVLDFAIDHNIALYTKVCENIGREPLSSILNKETNDIAIAITSSNGYINNIFRNIKNSLGFGFVQ